MLKRGIGRATGEIDFEFYWGVLWFGEESRIEEESVLDVNLFEIFRAGEEERIFSLL